MHKCLQDDNDADGNVDNQAVYLFIYSHQMDILQHCGLLTGRNRRQMLPKYTGKY